MPSSLPVFTRRDLRLWLACAALLALAFLPKLVPGWASSDDLALYTSVIGERAHRAQYLSQGRFGMALLDLVLLRLGMDPVHAPSFFSLVSIALFAACAVLLARLWELQDDLPAALAACALPFVHPHLSDTWSFHIGPIYTSLALLLGLAGLWLLRRAKGFLFLPIVLVTASLSVYQIAFNPLLIAALLGALVDLARVHQSPEGRRAAGRVWLVIALALAAGLALYLLLNRAVLAATGLGAEARNGLLAPGHWLARLHELGPVYAQVFWSNRALSAPWLINLQLGLGGLTLLLLAWNLRRSGASLPLSLLLVGCAGLCVVGVVGAAVVFYPSPRTLNGLGFFWGGLLATALVLGGPRLRLPLLVGSAIVAAGFLAIGHRAANEQLRRNARDLAIAGRLAGRFEVLPGWPGVRRVLLVDAPLDDGDLRTVSGNLNNSALGADWSPGALLQEVTGRPLAPGSAQDRERLRPGCLARPRWPAPGSAWVEGEVAVACF